MNLKQLIKTEKPVTETTKANLSTYARQMHACLGLTTEAAEVADIFKKSIYYNKPVNIQHLHEELGDVLWYAALLCDCYGWTFEELITATKLKLNLRYPQP